MAPTFVELEQVPDELRAAMMRLVLEEAGIPVIVENGPLQIYITGTHAPVRVLVPADRVQDARRALEDAPSRIEEES